MDKARQAVSDFMSKSGHHDTTVHESVAPAVTHETVKPTRHENITTAIDKEVHQDHYHTSVQPIADKKVLPEQHSHNIVPVEHREFHHGDRSAHEGVKTKLAETAAQFKDKSVVAPTHETHSTVPTVAGEHIHHHVHETIQPVVQRETVQPHVVHTTIPVHEVHHKSPQHHTVSALPAVTMDEFKNHGGSLTGREERFDGFKGEPRNIGGALGTTSTGHSSHDHTKLNHGTEAAVGAGAVGAAGAAAHHHHNSAGTTGATAGTGTTANKTAHPQSTTGGVQHNNSLLNKLDPRVDSNGDGKAGFMK